MRHWILTHSCNFTVSPQEMQWKWPRDTELQCLQNGPFHLQYFIFCISISTNVNKISHLRNKHLFILRCYKHGSHTYQLQPLTSGGTIFLKYLSQKTNSMTSEDHVNDTALPSVYHHFLCDPPVSPLMISDKSSSSN